jgi:Ca2+-binding RTX toxin-like protein
VLGDNGQIDWTATSGVISEVKTTDLGLGGNDVILAGNGDNVVLGGFGTDVITTGTGTDVILGDNGLLQYTTVTTVTGDVAVLTAAQTTDVTVVTGGSDVIVGGGGTVGDVILAGVGADVVTTVAASTSTVLTGVIVAGDTWRLDLLAGGVTTTFSYVPVAGDTLADVVAGLAAAINAITTDDYVAIVDGNALVVINPTGVSFTATYTVAPVASPTALVVVASATAVVATSSGGDVVVGDNGYATWDTTGLITTFGSTQLPYDPLVTDLGGNDVIYVGDGNNVVVGGFGNDIIATGTGNDTVLGDNGQIDATNPAAIVVTTTDVVNATGGNDIITVGDGNNLVLGGVGNDFVVSGTGADVVIGDNGTIIVDSSGAALLATSTDPLLGGNDTIATGDGFDIAIGGAGNDLVTSTGGNDVLFGDGGQVTFTVGGTTLDIMSVDTLFGGNDTLDGGAGNNILIGGAGSDLLYGTLSTDVLFGSYGSVTLVNGMVTRMDGDMSDLLTAAMLGQFTGSRGAAEEAIAGLPEGLPGYATVNLDGFGGLFGDFLLDDSVFQQVFRFSMSSLPVDELDAAMFEQTFSFDAVTRPDAPTHDPILELGDEDRPAGQVGDEQDPVGVSVKPLSFETTSPEDSERSGGDVIVAALGMAGLHAVQPPQSRGRRPLVRGVMPNAAGRVPLRARKSLDLITPM